MLPPKNTFLWTSTILLLAGAAHADETLYNGIVLPEEWPPVDEDGQLSADVMVVPYLMEPPEVIAIDVGRQLFVDDFLIEDTTCSRRYHQPRSHPDNPLIRADREWEAYVIPFSGGAWYDPTDALFKLWYSCYDGVLDGEEGGLGELCLATSEDGVSWDKPDVGNGQNIVLTTNHDSSTVWLDHDAEYADERFKWFATEFAGTQDGDRTWAISYRTSADGIEWSEPHAQQEVWGDRTTAFYNPFRDVWVLSQRIEGEPVGRSRAYLEASTPLQLIDEATYNPAIDGKTEITGSSVLWVGADQYDPRHPWVENEDPAELYTLDATPYESLMLGLFSIYQGDPGHKNFVLTGFSRDGFHWWRPDRRPFLYDERGEGWVLSHQGTSGKTEVAHLTTDLQSVGGGCLVVGDELYFYAKSWPKDGEEGATNLYTLRRDGFASIEAGEETQTLTTRLVTFEGSYLFVNVDNPLGELLVEILDADGNVIEPFSVDESDPVSEDSTLTQMTWESGDDLSTLAGTPVQFRFHLRNTSLYAFWVSPDPSGASYGYVGAGGPGFTGPIDTAGSEAQPGPGGSDTQSSSARAARCGCTLIDSGPHRWAWAGLIFGMAWLTGRTLRRAG